MPYSITTKDGITINNIPDDVAPDSQELKDRVAKIRAGETEAPRALAAPKEPPSVASTLAPEILNPEVRRQVGLFARSIPGSIANVAGLVGDPLNALVNLITGSKLQTISGATENLMTQAGLPEPSPGVEQTIYNVNTAALGASAPASMISRATRAIPTSVSTPRIEPTFAQQNIVQPLQQAFGGNVGLQTTGAVGSSLASQLAAQSGAGVVGQIGAGLLGGVAAPATLQTATGRVAAGGKEAVRPFTESGREVIAGNVLRQISAEPDMAALRAGTYEPRIPGYTPTTAQATRDVGLISAEPVIRSMDTTGRFVTQQSAANQARMTILDRLAKDQTDLEKAVAKRNEITGPLRENAFARSTVTPEEFQANVNNSVNKVIDDILASPSGKRGSVIEVMKDARTSVARGDTPQALYEIRKDLRASEQGLLDKSGAGGPSSSAFKAANIQLNQVIKAVDDVIEQSAPGYKDYLDKYAKASKGIDALAAAQKFKGKVLQTVPDPITGDYMISQPAFTRAIREIEKGGFVGLSRTQIAALKRVSKDLDDGVLNRAGKMPGSDTFKNMSTANVIGGIIGKQIFGETSPFLQKVATPMNWLYNGTDDRIRELLVDAMLDPKLASKLMAKATTANVESIGQELQRRAINLGYGSIFGLTE